MGQGSSDKVVPAGSQTQAVQAQASQYASGGSWSQGWLLSSLGCSGEAWDRLVPCRWSCTQLATVSHPLGVGRDAVREAAAELGAFCAACPDVVLQDQTSLGPTKGPEEGGIPEEGHKRNFIHLLILIFLEN